MSVAFPSPLRVLPADREPPMRRALRRLVGGTGDRFAWSEADSLPSLLSMLPDPDTGLGIVDERSPGHALGSGAGVLRRAGCRAPLSVVTNRSDTLPQQARGSALAVAFGDRLRVGRLVRAAVHHLLAPG